MSIRHAILGVLVDGTMHGYQIASELERRIAGGRYNSAQIYGSLHALAERGLVIPTDPEPGLSRDRRPFAITAEGRDEFRAWLRSPLIPARPLRDDGLVKLVFLGMKDRRELIHLLERLRRHHMRRLAGSRRSIDLSAGSDGTVDRGVLADLSAAALRFREEAELRWIDHCLTKLRMLHDAEEDEADDAADDDPAKHTSKS